MNDGHVLHKWMRALRSRKTACWLLGLTAAQLLNPDYKCPLVVGKAFEGDVASHGLHEFAT